MKPVHNPVRWLEFLGRKILRLSGLLLAMAVLSYTLVSFSPVDPVDAYLGPEILKISQEQRQKIRERWGLDASPVVRFQRWGTQILRGNFGISNIYNEPVLSVIGKRFATSFWLMFFAWALSGFLGFTLGVLAGATEGSLLDKSIRGYAYLLASTPAFWVGMLLLALFAVHLGWAPVCCAWPIGLSAEEATWGDRLRHLVLPAATLSVIGVAQITLHTREKIIAALQSDYALFALSLGEKKWGIVVHHALRNAALPAVTLQFASLGELFGGAVLAEQVFSYPGLGKATVEAGYRGDVPLLLGIVLFSTVFVFVGNTCADLLYAVVDPRMRTGFSEHQT